MGRQWIATANDFIGCRDGEMTISNGLSTQRLISYPPAQPITENSWWLNCSFGDKYFDDLSLPSDFSWALQEQTIENVLNLFVSSTTCTDFPQSFTQINHIFRDKFQENMALSMFIETPCVFTIKESIGPYTIPCEVGPEKFLHIHAGLSENQQAQLLKVLKKQDGAFA